MRILNLSDFKSQNRLQIFLLGIVILIFYLAASIAVNPPLQYFLLAALPLFAIILAHPEHGVYYMIFGMLIFEKFFTQKPFLVGGTEYKIYFLDFIIIFTIISVLVKMLKGEWKIKERLKWGKMETFISLFIFINAVAFIRSAFNSLSYYSLAFSTLKNYALYAIIYFLILFIFAERKKREELLSIFLYAGSAILVFIFIGIARGDGLWAEAAPLSTHGTRLIAGTHAFYILLSGMFALALAVKRDAAHFLNAAGSLTQRRYIELIVWLSAFAFLLSLVRHLWLAFLIVAAFLFWYLGRKERAAFAKIIGRILFFIAGAAVIAAIVFAAFDAAPRPVSKSIYSLKERLDISLWFKGSSDTSVGYRYALWESAFKLFASNVIFGAGTGLLLESEIDGVFFAAPARDIHNNYLGILSQLGIVGLGIIIVWFFEMLRAIIIARKTAAKDPIALWSIFSVLLFMVIFAFSVYWDSNVFVTLWWFVLAIFKLDVFEPIETRGKFETVAKLQKYGRIR